MKIFVTLLIVLTFWGCGVFSPLTYEQLIPDDYYPSDQSKLKVNVDVTGGPNPCVYSYPHEMTPEMFKKALIKSAGQILSEPDSQQQFTIIIKDINCCVGHEIAPRKCTGKSYWALRDNSSQHVIWQEYIKEIGLGSAYIFDGGTRIEASIANYAKQTIAAGLTALSEVDLAVAEKNIEMLSEQWHTYRRADILLRLYQYLFFTSINDNFRAIELKDAIHNVENKNVIFKEFMGKPRVAFTKQYVNDLIDKPDNIHSWSGDKQTWEWLMKMDETEMVFRLSFQANLLSDGSFQLSKKKR